MTQPQPLSEIKRLYPDEWVLLGNPEMTESRLEVISGNPLFHSKDKREVCYPGRDTAGQYSKITLIYTGLQRPSRKITSLFNRVK